MSLRFLLTGPGVENGRQYFDSKQKAIDEGRLAVLREPSMNAVMVTQEENPADLELDVPKGDNAPRRLDEHEILRDRMVWHSKSWQEREYLDGLRASTATQATDP